MSFNDMPIAGSICRLSENGDEYDGIPVRIMLTRGREATIGPIRDKDKSLILRFKEEYGRGDAEWIGNTHLDPIPALEQLAMEAE